MSVTVESIRRRHRRRVGVDDDLGVPVLLSPRDAALRRLGELRRQADRFAALVAAAEAKLATTTLPPGKAAATAADARHLAKQGAANARRVLDEAETAFRTRWKDE